MNPKLSAPQQRALAFMERRGFGGIDRADMTMAHINQRTLTNLERLGFIRLGFRAEYYVFTAKGQEWAIEHAS